MPSNLAPFVVVLAGGLVLAGAAAVRAEEADVPAADAVAESAPAAPSPAASPAAPRVRLDETVITGTRTEHPVDEAPVPTQVVPRVEIERMVSDNLDEVLNQIPDVYVQRNEEFGLGASVVRMQGADPNKVAIVLDGQRFRGGVDGVVDLRDVLVGPIEQVEIIRGPASSLYGSDAMGGVINIRTRGGSLDPYAKVTAAGGSYGRQIYSLNHGYHLGPVRYFVSAQHDQIEIAELLGPISAQFAGDASNDTQKRDAAFVRLDLPVEKHELRLTNDFLRERNPLSDNDDLTTGLLWTWRPTDAWEIATSGSRYAFDRENDLPGFVEDVTYRDWSGETRVSRDVPELFGATQLVSFGLRGHLETLEAPAQAIGGNDGFEAPPIDADASQISGFLQDEIFLGDQVSLVLGASVDDHDRYGIEFNPRATVSWWPRDGMRLSFTAGRGFRAPDLLQLFDVDLNNIVAVGDAITGYAIIGNPDLEAETDVAFSLYGEVGWSDLAHVGLSLYRHQFRDLIGTVIACASRGNCQPGFTSPVPDLEGPVFTFANVDEALTQGIELSIQTRPLKLAGVDTGSHDFELAVGYGFLDSENQSGRAGEDGNALPFRPRHRVLPSATWTQARSGTTLRAWGDYEDTIYTDLANTPSGAVGRYWLWSFKLAQETGSLAEVLGATPPDWLRGLVVFVEGKNVFDRVVHSGAIAAVSRQFTARATFVGGVSYEWGAR